MIESVYFLYYLAVRVIYVVPCLIFPEMVFPPTMKFILYVILLAIPLLISKQARVEIDYK